MTIQKPCQEIDKNKLKIKVYLQFKVG